MEYADGSRSWWPVVLEKRASHLARGPMDLFDRVPPQRDRARALQLHHPVVILACEQTQRKPDHARGMTEHPVHGEIGLAGSRGPLEEDTAARRAAQLVCEGLVLQEQVERVHCLALGGGCANNVGEAIAHLTAATTTNPKFALAWHNLGVLQDFQTKYDEAAAAYAKAIEANPKMLSPYVTLARIQVRKRDWEGVNKTVAVFLPLDKNLIFPEMSLHQAAAQYELKNLTAAEASATAALNPKAKQSARRAEYVLGRILEAKGDMAGAKQHMNRYLELVPKAIDADVIKAHIAQMGQPGAPEPDLDNLSK